MARPRKLNEVPEAMPKKKKEDVKTGKPGENDPQGKVKMES